MLLKEDLKTHLYDEQIEVISRNDEDLLTKAISAAEGEAKGYLSRYDIPTIFAAKDETRDDTLLMWLKDMATWHFITLANAAADMEFRESRYKNALSWLKGIQKGDTVPYGWPKVTEETSQDFFHVASSPKRKTNF